MSPNLAHSVQVRLVRHAKELNLDPNLVLARYGAERLLYRLSQSRHAERFVLKGALLMLVWLGEAIRPTRDTDLLGFGDLDAQALERTFTELCQIEVQPDGLVFDPASIKVAAIRAEDAYGGQRVTLLARLERARLRIQVDVGIGDVVSPEPEWLEYPSLLDLPRPRLRAYRPETAIAEKLHAMVTLGTKNSRMRDFFDIHALASQRAFEGGALVQAVRATFEHRRTPLPDDSPVAFTPAFAESEGKQAQWGGFLRQNRLTSAPADLGTVVDEIARFLQPMIRAAASRSATSPGTWTAGGPWRSRG